jgi:hypothetical protein
MPGANLMFNQGNKSSKIRIDKLIERTARFERFQYSLI